MRLRSISTHLVMLVIIAAAALALRPTPAAAADRAIVLEIDGAIGPPLADYIARELTAARTDEARRIVLRMNTPGGLDTSMRKIISAILASPVPVATYVAPNGARAHWRILRINQTWTWWPLTRRAEWPGFASAGSTSTAARSSRWAYTRNFAAGAWGGRYWRRPSGACRAGEQSVSWWRPMTSGMPRSRCMSRLASP